jgi:hypothetical protein
MIIAAERLKSIVSYQSILVSQGALLQLASFDYLHGVINDDTEFVKNIHTQVENLGVDIMTNHYCSSFIFIYSLFESLLFDLVFHHYLNSNHSRNDSTYTVSAADLFDNDIIFHRKSWAESCARNVMSLNTNDFFKKISKLFNLKLTDIDSKKSSLSEIRARRNIALHRGWIADRSYSLNFAKDDSLIGTYLYVDKDYFKNSTNVMVSVADWFISEFRKKGL